MANGEGLDRPTREGGKFPSTHWSAIRTAADPQSPERRASLEKLARLYWKPVYAHFRLKWSRAPEEAKDLTQEVFVALLEKDFLQDLSPEHGRFRAYLRAALDNFARYEHRHNSRKKRGGGVLRLSLDDIGGYEPAASTSGPDDPFFQEWRQCVMQDALRELEKRYRNAGLEKAWEIFYLRDVYSASDDTKPSYDTLARRFGVRVTDVTNFLYRARKELRELVLERVRETVSDEEEATRELRELFGKEL